MRLDNNEKKALKYALKDFEGKVYIFGSRADDNKKGGDIDILIFPKKNTGYFDLKIQIQKDFFLKCEQKLDVIIYDKHDLFCKEVLKNAKKLTL